MTKTSVVLIVAVLSTLCIQLVSFAAGKTVSLRAYARALTVVKESLDTSAALIDKDADLVDEMPGDTAKRVLGPITSVRLPDGTIQPVDTKALTSAIATSDNAKYADDQSAGYKAMSRRLAFLNQECLDSVNSSGNSGTQSASKSKALAHNILSGPAFASEPVPPPSWMERQMMTFSKWLEKTLNKLFKRPTRNANMPPVNPKVLWGILWVIVAALFVLLVWIIAQFIGRRQKKFKPLAVSDAEEALVEARDKDTLMTIAEKHARSGDFRAAFRLVYLATLIALDLDGILRFDRSKTNWEYVRQLRNSGNANAHDVLLPLTRDFDRIWYGLSAASPDVYHKAVIEYEKLIAPPEKASADANA